MAQRMKGQSSGTVYRIKVTLKGGKPPIWRRLDIAGDTTLLKLHRIIQVAMGWTDSHLHQFIINHEHYSRPDFELDCLDERKAKLDKVVKSEKSKFVYEYDFGDDWIHEIVVEKILPAEDGKRYPAILAGKRACPPEDVGGVWGYADFVEAIGDPDHTEHEAMMEWADPDFDPEAFDIVHVQEKLMRLK